MRSRKTLRWLPALLAVGLLTGCSSQDPFQDLPSGGVDARTGQLVIDDIWIDAPHGLTAGANAPLRLTMTNESATGDALVGVSVPDAAHTVIQSNGHTVASIVLPAGSQIDLESRTGVDLEGFRQSFIPGQRIPVTLTFAQAAPVTVQATVGPLPESPSTPAPSTPAPSTPAPSSPATP